MEQLGSLFKGSIKSVRSIYNHLQLSCKRWTSTKFPRLELPEKVLTGDTKGRWSMTQTREK